ncbi:hypothetical protein LG329_08855 [Virgibacillus necropolis]
MNYGDIQQRIGQVTDSTMQEKLETTVTTIMETGFNHLFITAGILAVLVTLTGFYIVKYSKQRNA